MSYTPTNWSTGDTITASALNKIEQGIVDGGSPWDAVIRLTHSNDSGADSPANLTPSIVSGTFADLKTKIVNGGCPCILVEYYHPLFGYRFAVPMAYVTYCGDNSISIAIVGCSFIGNRSFTYYGEIGWVEDDSLVWN